MDVNDTYINILIDILKKKLTLLEDILNETLLQKKYLYETPVDIGKYQTSFEVKEDIINNISELDQAFDSMYARIKEDITNNRSKYKDDIVYLQALIHDLTDISLKIQLQEKNNKIKIEHYFSNQKSEIKQKKIINRTALEYYKNMIDQHQEGQSYFIDKKK